MCLVQIQEWEERGLPLLLRRGQAPAQSCAQQLDILTLGKEQPLGVHLHLHKALMLQVCVSQALAMNLLPDRGDPASWNSCLSWGKRQGQACLEPKRSQCEQTKMVCVCEGLSLSMTLF